MAGQADCRAVDGASCCTFWLSESGNRHNLPSSPFWCWRSNIASLLCIQDITPFWRCQTGLVLVLLCHCCLVDRIEENNKMVIVGLRLVSSQTRLLPTMTLYSTINLDYCRVQLKKKKHKIQKKVEQVLAGVNTTFHGTWCWHVQTDRLPRSGKWATPSAISRMAGEADHQMLLKK